VRGLTPLAHSLKTLAWSRAAREGKDAAIIELGVSGAWTQAAARPGAPRPPVRRATPWETHRLRVGRQCSRRAGRCQADFIRPALIGALCSSRPLCGRVPFRRGWQGGTGGLPASAQKSEKFFWGAGGFWGRFLGGRNRIWRAAGAFWGVERSVWGAKRPVLTSILPRFAPYMPHTAPVLPRKHLVLPPMLWSDVDGIGGFPRSLARDLHAGGGNGPKSKVQGPRLARRSPEPIEGAKAGLKPPACRLRLWTLDFGP